MNGVVSDLAEQVYDELIGMALFEIANHIAEEFRSDYVPT